MRKLCGCILGTFTRAFLFCGLVCFAVFSISFLLDLVQPQAMDKPDQSPLKTSEFDWKTLDPFAHVIPVNSKLSDLSAENSAFINVDGRRVFYREYKPTEATKPSTQHLLLLHGRSFSSETWEKLGTLALMAANGHRAIAVDLPGFGRTGGEAYKEKGRGEFLSKLIEALELRQPVVVSPSMSGSYSMPFLVVHPEQLSGFVPVAPTATNTVTQAQLAAVKVPTMAVVGSEDDTGLAEQSMLNLQALPHVLEVELSGASHAAYLSQPQLFHSALYNFMLALRNSTA